MLMKIVLHSLLNLTIKIRYPGEHDTKRSGEADTLRIAAKPYRYFRHSGYVYNQNRGAVYDFALVELARSVHFGRHSHIRPVCLPSTEEVDYDGDTATVAGWGVDRVGRCRWAII